MTTTSHAGDDRDQALSALLSRNIRRLVSCVRSDGSGEAPIETCIYTCDSHDRCDFEDCRRVVAESVELAPMGIAYETRTVIEAVSADPAGYGASALDAIDVRASGMVALSMRQHRLHRRYRAARGTRLTGVVEAMAVRQERFEAAATGL